MGSFGDLHGRPIVRKIGRPFHVLTVEFCNGKRAGDDKRAKLFRRRGTGIGIFVVALRQPLSIKMQQMMKNGKKRDVMPVTLFFMIFLLMCSTAKPVKILLIKVTNHGSRHPNQETDYGQSNSAKK